MGGAQGGPADQEDGAQAGRTEMWHPADQEDRAQAGRIEMERPADQEDGTQVGRKEIGGSGGPCRPRRRRPGCPSYLAPVGVGVFTHDALVVPDVLEGLAGETPARSTHSCAHLGPAPIEAGPAEAGACQTSALAGLGAVTSALSPRTSLSVVPCRRLLCWLLLKQDLPGRGLGRWEGAGGKAGSLLWGNTRGLALYLCAQERS